MNRYLSKALLLICWFLPLAVAAQEDDVRANVATSLQQDKDVWTGQQVTINLDLKTTGFSFSNSHFNLPEVSGAFLMQTDTTTIKLSESIDGETWQIIRYPLALYPQKAGQLNIPPIEVRFTSSAGFGSTEKAFEFQTEPLLLTVSSPPGVKEGDLVISTTSFELSYSWQPETVSAKTGDAFTLTVSRQAKDISGMLLPPLPVFRTDGLSAYPQAPEVNDKTNRGELTGERIDSITWVIEKPGKYDIPGIRFQWWDPDNHELKQQIIPGQTLDIQPSAMIDVKNGVGNQPTPPGNILLWLLLAAFTALAAIYFWLHFAHKDLGRSEETEKSTFATLQKACRSNKAGQTHAALHTWIAWSSRTSTLSAFARLHDDARLKAELEQLQEAIISADRNWQGDELLNSLQHIRHTTRRQKIVQSRAQLAPLNPKWTNL